MVSLNVPITWKSLKVLIQLRMKLLNPTVRTALMSSENLILIKAGWYTPAIDIAKPASEALVRATYVKYAASTVDKALPRTSIRMVIHLSAENSM